MITKTQNVISADGTETIITVEFPDDFFASPTPEPTIEERTTALETTQADVIDILATALGVTI